MINNKPDKQFSHDTTKRPGVNWERILLKIIRIMNI